MNEGEEAENQEQILKKKEEEEKISKENAVFNKLNYLYYFVFYYFD